MLFFVAPYGPRERKFLFEPHGRAEVNTGRDEKKVRVELTEQFIEWLERAAPGGRGGTLALGVFADP